MLSTDGNNTVFGSMNLTLELEADGSIQIPKGQIIKQLLNTIKKIEPKILAKIGDLSSPETTYNKTILTT